MIPKDVELISSYGSDPKNRYFYTMVLDSDPGNCTWPGTPFRCNMDVFLYLFNCFYIPVIMCGICIYIYVCIHTCVCDRFDSKRWMFVEPRFSLRYWNSKSTHLFVPVTSALRIPFAPPAASERWLSRLNIQPIGPPPTCKGISRTSMISLTARIVWTQGLLDSTGVLAASLLCKVHLCFDW